STRSESPSVFQFVDANRNKFMNGNVNWTYRKTPRFTATFSYGYNQNISRSLPYFANKINVSKDAGITGNNQDAPYWGPPNLNFTNYAGLNEGRYFSTRTQPPSFGYNGF